MTYFPLFLNMENRELLIFGGNLHALQKIEKLLPFSPKIKVISENILEEIKQIKEIELEERAFKKEDLDSSPSLVIISEERSKTKEIYELCQKKHLLVNAVDMPEFCDVIFPAVISRKHLCIGISSGGISPTATVELKKKVEALLPQNIDSILEWMFEIRKTVQKELKKEVWKEALRALFENALLENAPLSEKESEKVISSFKTEF